MRDKDDCFLELFLQVDEHVLHVVPDQRIESAECFVHQQDIGISCQRPAQANPLLHAAGEFSGIAVSEVFKTDTFDPARRAPFDFRAFQPLNPQAETNVVADGAVRQECETLEHH